MPVLISMSIAVLTWSLYPLAASVGLQTMGGLEMIFFIYLFSGIGSLLVSIFYLSRQGIFKKSIRLQTQLPQNAYFTMAISGIAGTLAHGFFIFALTLANKGGVSLLFEAWPIIAVISTPLFMKKQWKQVSFKEFVVCLIALVGIAIVILSDEEVNFNFGSSLFANISLATFGGYALAFGGAYMSAIIAVTKGAYAEHLTNLNDEFGACIISETISRTISMILMLIVFMIFVDDIEIKAENLLPAFYIGFIVLVVGSIFYTNSLLNAESPTIHILYYFVPVLAVIWLWMAGEATINAGLFIGGAIILAANLYLAIAGRKASFEDKTSGL